jgi:succinate dehydrogenase / fumarate reductase cytochrome b subunit
MADAHRAARPLSPHLTIYRIVWRPQMTSFSSMMHRITGNALPAAFILGVAWLLAAAMGPEAFATANWLATSWLGDLVFSFSLLAIWYHFLAGLRHLLYDAGKGMELRTAEMLGWGCVIGSVVLTVITLLLV